MVNKEEIFPKIVPIIAEQLKIKPEEIKPDSKFIDDLGADSLDAVEIVMGIEERFNVEISDEEIDKIKIVKDIVDYLARKIVDG